MRRWVATLPALALLAAGPAEPRWPAITGPVPLTLPADQGAHPDYRTEWWYVTGWLETEAGEPLGFQVTFFRTRPLIGEDNPSAFAPTQILFAHAALADPAIGELRHGERSARAGFGVAGARVGAIDVNVADWRLVRGSRWGDPGAGGGRGLRLGTDAHPHPAADGAGDRRLFPQGPARGSGEPLRLRPPAGGQRPGGARRRGRGGHRHGVDGPGMVVGPARPRRGRLGLDRPERRRRVRADGPSASAAPMGPACGPAAAGATRPGASPRWASTTCASARSPGGPAPGQAAVIR